MVSPRFQNPKCGDTVTSPHLYVANCGPGVGLSYESIASVFSTYGQVKGVYAADESGTRVIVSYADCTSAEAALNSLNGVPCHQLGHRSLYIKYSVQSQCKVDTSGLLNVSTSAKDVDIPGLYLVHPLFLQYLRGSNHVNEYPPGVGLSPHIDTHSAFEGFIFSLSLSGPCIMEFRKYNTGEWHSNGDDEKQSYSKDANFLRKAVFLPPRSILVLSGEARYAWHHYIPHHKVDKVQDNLIRRSSRRVSFTLRKVRENPCACEFSQYCDSQK